MQSTAAIAVFWTVAGFIFGSIPFAFLIGKLFFKIDIRDYGDGNPGSTNLWKACGIGWGILAYIFDFAKGTVPVAICFFHYQITDWWIVPVALAPIAGHAFSVFLNFRGGKAIATSYGVWAGLTIWEAPLTLIISTYFVSAFQKVHCWTQVFTMLLLLIYVVARFYAQPVFLPLMAVWTGNLLIIVIRHWNEFKVQPRPQEWLLSSGKKQP